MLAGTNTVLIVDDEEDLLHLLAFNLRDTGFEVVTATTARAGFALAEARRPAVIVLDLMLPDAPGTEVLRRIRGAPALADVGVMMLTARGDEVDRVVGFELGADDYVVKPFSVREVVLRVRALSRRTRERDDARASADTGRRLRWRGLSVDPVRHRVEADGEVLTLRPIEFRFLLLLLESPTQLFSREDILRVLWGPEADVAPRTIDTHVRRLRDALGVYADAIETVHGFGYRLRDA
jgi:two-component system phosphate regulon response regulator PhoB